MEPETEPLGMRTNCLPTEKSLDLLMDHAWPIVARIAGQLVASGWCERPTVTPGDPVEIAVKMARRIVAEAQKSKTPSNDVRGYTLNGEPCDIGNLAAKLSKSDCEKIQQLIVGQPFVLSGTSSPSPVLRRVR